jgi:hypothetical protein
MALAALALALVPVAEREIAARIKSQIERAGSLTVASVEVKLLSRGIILKDLHYRRDGIVSAESWSLSGLSPSQFLRWELLAGRYRLGDPVHAEHVTIDGLRFTGGSSLSWSVGSVEIDDFDLASYDRNVSSSANSVTIMGARVLHSLSVRRVEMNNFTFSQGGPGNGFSIARVAIDDISRGRLGSLRFMELAAGGKPDVPPAFRLDQIKVTGLDFDRVLRRMSADTWHLGMPSGRIELQSALASGFGGELLSRYGISLDRVTIDTTSDGKAVKRVRTRLDGFVVAPPPGGPEALKVRTMLAMMGLTELRMGFDCSGREDRENGEVTVEPCAFSGADLAKVEVAVRLQQADAAFWQAVDDNDYARLLKSNIALSSASLVLADHSLLERLIKMIAASSGQPESLARTALAQQIRQFQPSGVLITEDMTKLLDTVARFVERGGTLSVDVKPDPPLGMGKLGPLMMPNPDLIEILGLKATLLPPS